MKYRMLLQLGGRFYKFTLYRKHQYSQIFRDQNIHNTQC